MRRALTIGKILFSIILLVWILNQVNFDELVDRIRNINWLVLTAAFALLTIQYSLSTLKWRIILSMDDVQVPFLYLLKSYYIGNFISLFLPSSFGGDIYRVYALKDHSLDVYKNTSSVLFDRLTGLFALISISMISLLFYSEASVNRWLFVLYVVGTGTFIMLASDRAIKALEDRQFRLMRIPLKILHSFNRYKKNTRTLMSVLFISFIFQSNIIFIVSLYCAAVGVDINYGYFFVVVPLIYLTEALPISINGLGIREGAFVFFFSQIGITKASAMAVAILVITIRYVYCLSIGGTLFLIRVAKVGRKQISHSKE